MTELFLMEKTHKIWNVIVSTVGGGRGSVLFCFYLIIKLNALHEKLFKGLSLLDKRRLVSIS